MLLPRHGVSGTGIYHVVLLITDAPSQMPHNLTRPDEYNYLESLYALDGSGSKGQVSARLKLLEASMIPI